MRVETTKDARTEVTVLDNAHDALERALKASYEELKSTKQGLTQGDAETVAALHNLKEGLQGSLEELARRGYGRVAILDEVDERGNFKRREVYRLSQANAGLQDPGIRILARNNRNAGRLASCRVGDEIEFSTPGGGERYFDVVGLIDLEGVTPLLRAKPNVALAHFAVIQDKAIDIVRDLRKFVRELDERPEAGGDKAPVPLQISEPGELFWPAHWDDVTLGDDEEASLGAHFFTRTTREQEAAIQTVRGVTVVEGVAGTGKTSVALGRLKFFANFRSGEHLDEYGLSSNDWVDFDPTDMVGFVLSPSLVQYLRQTANMLELSGMKIQDFEEYREQERQARRLFGRPFRRSSIRNSATQRTITWLMMLDSVLSGYCSEAILRILTEPLPKPETPDGRAVPDVRWRKLEEDFWKAGPMRARINGLVRRLGGAGRASATGFRLHGLLAALDRDVRLLEHEVASLELGERHALREAVENAAQRFFRIFNPTDLLVAAYQRVDASGESLSLTEDARQAAKESAERVSQNEATDDDVVTALCLNALCCDRFDRDIANIPYLRDFAERVAVFIDEYQDFSEQQVFLMGYRARPKYRQITVAGDPSQRLHRDGLSDIVTALPFVDGSIRSVFLDINLRQSKALGLLSSCVRKLTERTPIAGMMASQAPLYCFNDDREFVELAIQRISSLPERARVAVICSDKETADQWFALMRDGLEGYFRHPVQSDRARLTERFKTHFTTPLDAKGLEFDVVVIPDISSFSAQDPIAVNGFYVAVSRPRHAILLGCNAVNANNGFVADLISMQHLVPTSTPSV